MSRSATDAVTQPGMLDGYAPRPGGFDEMLGPDGQVRPHWRRLMAGLADMGPDLLAERWRSAERQIVENAAIYNAFAEGEARDRPWQLDPVPLVLSAEEWRHIAGGLQQRARLINAILNDLYGAQRILHEGLVPSALLFANPHFLRPCHGTRLPSDVWLHLLACDLGRGSDGRWRVLSDRTQTPTGAGFALENRIIVSRGLPELFRGEHVHRLAGFFQRRHDGMLALSPRDNPRIVLLSPGSHVEPYFEHAYLARYLGYTLVEGPDLTTRDNHVYLKTVDGLKRVDVILRRVDSAECDPLELNPQSPHGIPGLLQAVRDGNVVVTNAIGAGVPECEAFLPFLPRLAEALLGERLTLDSDAAWWCGDPGQLEAVRGRLDDLAFYPAFARRPMLSHDMAPLRPAVMGEAERARLLRRLERRGYELVAREPLHVSTAPVLGDGRLTPAPMVLRVFAAATPDGWQVMPGGLARVSTDGRSETAGMPRRGNGSKDVWVLSDGPVSTFSLLRAPHHQPTLVRRGRDLPSRAADNLFWLGRYADRAEGAVRLLRSLLVRLAEDAGDPDGPEEQRLVEAMVEQGLLEETARDLPLGLGSPALLAALDKADQPGSLEHVLRDLLRNAALVRDRLSIDAWRTLNLLRSGASATDGRRSRLDVGTALDRLDARLLILAAFSGMEMENMTRNHGWRFLDLGRRLERALHLVDLLRVFAATDRTGDDEANLPLLLELADSFMTFRSRYMTTPRLEPVLDLLLADESNPRSVGFQLAALERHVEALPHEGELPLSRPERRLALALLTELRLADIEELCAVDEDGNRPQLIRLLDRLGSELPRLSDVIARAYFSHAERSRPVDAEGRVLHR